MPKFESPNIWVQVDAAVWILSGKSVFVYTQGEGREGGAGEQSQGKADSAVARSSGLVLGSQGSVNADAAGWVYTWVCCLICSVSPLPSLEGGIGFLSSVFCTEFLRAGRIT